MTSFHIGILAHVDAGKTSLTERLLFDAGVIDTIGSVDAGSTQTDTLALERQRGITIKSAVASFVIDDVTVNLIDTPGHPDFIAEVERVLRVLDGAVLVISAVEGVQAQTRVLMRALQRLRIPTLLFINKIDRPGAHTDRVLQGIAERLTPAILPMGVTSGLGTTNACYMPYRPTDTDFYTRLLDLLAANNDRLLAAYVNNEATISYAQLHCELAAQTQQALVYPVFFGSAITGAGVESLIAGIKELLPAAKADVDGPVSGTVFKIERGPGGEKIAYVRLFSGRVQVRDRVPVGAANEAKVTAISVFERGPAVRRPFLVAGQIGKLWGLADAQIGDAIGLVPTATEQRTFAPPTLETAIVPSRPADKGALHVALVQLAEQDPLINLRQDDIKHELFVSLYGEVQKEVIQATLANDFGIDVSFRETTPICIERPIGSGAAVELLGKAANPFLATVGLRIEPTPPGSGVTFALDAKVETLPLFIYKAAEEFQQAMEGTIRETLREGLYGWQVTDCTVTMTHSGYTSPSSGARDFRLLTPLVLMDALKHAGTTVCEPIHRFGLEIPANSFQAILPVLVRLRATLQTQHMEGTSYLLEGAIPAVRVHEFQHQLTGLTHGEGVFESVFDHYKAVDGPIPMRPRTDHNPLNRKEYLLHVLRRV